MSTLLKTHQTLYRDHDFSKQDLQDLVFDKCQFYGCNFSRSDLTETKFIDCVFIESGNVLGCDFSHAKLKEASFKNCNLSMAIFDGADAFGIEMRHCHLKGVSFVRTNFANHITHNTYFCSAYITNCDLSYANLERQKLEKCDLFENRWGGANLSGSSFKGSDLSRGEFTAEQWEQAQWNDANLSHVDLNGLDIRRITLTGVIICQWQQEQLLSNLGLVVVSDNA